MKTNIIRKWSAGLAIAVATILAATGCASSGNAGSGGGTDGTPIDIGLVLSYTGNFATQATDFENGFTAALDHLTNGTMKIDGRPIKLIKEDDTGDAAVGTSKAKQLIGEGVKIIAGPTSSSVALGVADQASQNGVLYIGGTSGTSGLVGMSNLVFGTSGVSPAGSYSNLKILGDNANGKSVSIVAQDYGYGQSTVQQLKALLEPHGVTVNSYLLPQTTTDFTGLMLKLKENPTDYLTSTWAGAGQDQLYNAFGTQNIINDKTKFFATLALRQSWAAIGESLGAGVDNTLFTLSYFPGATGNEKDKALIEYSKAHSHKIEYDDVVGWNAGEMAYRALTKGSPEDTNAMATALKDWSFEGPAGEVEIRGEDNQVTVPSFVVKLKKQGDGTWDVQKEAAYTAKDLITPVVKPIKK